MTLPFGIDRASRVNFADQVVEGVREAIAIGKYRTGDALPPLRELAKILGVATRVTKEALAKLSAMGLVNPRPRLGSVIAPRGTKIWKGRVLLVESRLIQVSYAFGAFELSFRERLNQAGYLVFRSTRDQLDDALCGPIGHPDEGASAGRLLVLGRGPSDLRGAHAHGRLLD